MRGDKRERCVRAGNGARADEEPDALGELVGEVPVGEVQRHGLAEEGLADADEEPADEQRPGREGGSLACRSDGPDKGADGDGGGGKDRLCEESSGNRQEDVGDCMRCSVFVLARFGEYN